MSTAEKVKESHLNGLALGMAVITILVLLFWLSPVVNDSDFVYGTVVDCEFAGVRGPEAPYPRATVKLEDGGDVTVFVEITSCTSGESITLKKQRGRFFINTTYVPADA